MAEPATAPLRPGAPAALMVFAAGRGTRMGGLTAARPKPLLAVAGQALLDHALGLAGDLPVVVNTHYLGDQIAAHLAGRPVTLSPEPELLDTGGGLKAALPLLPPGPVFTLNADAVWSGPSPLEVLRAAWDPGRMDALLLLIPRPSARAHRGTGDFLLAPDGRITRGPGLVYGGAQILRTEPVAAVSARVFSLNRVWDSLIATGRAFGLAYPGGWCDVGRPEGLSAAEVLMDGAAHG